MKQTWPYLLLVIALFLGINAPSLFSEGMFMDGLFYSSISRNLAEGKGTFWDLYYTETYNYHFHGHPPLAMGLESLFYRFFGDHIFVEHIYSLVAFLIASFLIVKIWILLVNKELKTLFWLPLLLYSIIGVVGWSVSNNMLENTMTVFVLLSFYLVLISLQNKKLSIRLFLIFCSGLALFLAFLTKGLVGLFPLGSFFFISLFSDKLTIKNGMSYSILMTLGLLLPFIIIYYFVPSGITSLYDYYQAQIVHSLTNVEIISNRYWIIWSLFHQLIPVLVIALLIYIFGKNKKKINVDSSFSFLIAIGLSGVLPILISLKQRDFYIVSAYPFFVLGIAILVAPYLQIILIHLESKKIVLKYIKIISILLLLVSFIIIGFQKGRIGRDKQMILDIKKISTIIPRGSIVAIPQRLSQNWALRGYFARYHNVSLTFDRAGAKYYLSEQESNLENFKEMEAFKPSHFHFYKSIED